MTPSPVDVVIAAHRGAAMTGECIQSVLAHAGSNLGKVIVVHDPGPDADLLPSLRALRDAEPRLRLIENEENLGFVRSANRGLALRSGDAVVLNNDTRVTEGWLDELVGVLSADERIAAASPLSNNATLCSVPEYQQAAPAESVASLDLRALPRWTEMPTLVGFCMLMRGAVLDLIGAFDPAYGRGYNEENDWCQRAQQRGFVVARANRAFVYHLGSVSFGEARAPLDAFNVRRLVARYPAYLEQNRAFDAGPQARVAAAAVSLTRRNLRVRIEAEESAPLVVAMQALEGVDVNGPGQSPDVVHLMRPMAELAQVAGVLRDSARLVMTMPDLSEVAAVERGHTWAEIERRRAALWALGQSADAVVVTSKAARDETADWLGVPTERVHHVPPAIDASPPSSSAAGSTPYLVTVALGGGTHNLELVLSAYRLLRRRGETRPLMVIGPSMLAAEGVIAAPPAVSRRSLVSGAACLITAAATRGPLPEQLEAFAAGVPVAHLALARPLDASLPAHVREAGDPVSASAAAIQRCLNDASLRDSFSARARAVVGDDALRTTARALRDLYRKLVASPDAAVLQTRVRLGALLQAR